MKVYCSQCDNPSVKGNDFCKECGEPRPKNYCSNRLCVSYKNKVLLEIDKEACDVCGKPTTLYIDANHLLII